MQKHVKVYFQHFWYDFDQVIECECCNEMAVEIHHIIYRSFFGKNKKHLQDVIENLIALCRDCHSKAHGSEEWFTKWELQEKRLNNL